MQPKSNKWAFLTSTRFWAIVIGAVALALAQDGWISMAFAQMIATVSAGFITVNTVDRFSTSSTTPAVETPILPQTATATTSVATPTEGGEV